jgi:hypothetical protein
VNDARPAVDGLRRGEHLVGNGRGEDRTRTGCVEHSNSDETAVKGLVPGATARDDRDLALHGSVLAQDDLVLEIDLDQIRMSRTEARKRLGDGVLRVVQELLDCLLLSDAHRSS